MIRWIKNHSFSVIISILAILAVLLFFLTIFHEDLPQYISKDFMISFRASLLEDLIFFSLIGLVLYLVTFKSIDDGEVDTRIESLINAKDVTEHAQEHFKKQFKSLLTYYKTLSVDIVLTEIDDKSKESGPYIKIESSFNGDIYNFSKDMNVVTDVRAYAFSDKKDNNLAGEVMLLEILDSNGQVLENGATAIVKVLPEEGFKKTMPVQVELNSYVQFRYKFWIWNLFSTSSDSKKNGFKISTDRFAETLKVKIKNNTSNNFDILLSKEVENEIGEGKQWKTLKDIKGLSSSKDKEFQVDNFKKDELISLNFIKKDK